MPAYPLTRARCLCPALLPQLLLLLTPGLCDSNSVYADAACIPPRCPAQHPLHQVPCATRPRSPSLPSLTAWRARCEQQKRQIQQPQRTRPASRPKQRSHRGSSSGSGGGGRGGDGNGDAGGARKAMAGRYCLRCRSCEIMCDSWVSLRVGRMKRPTCPTEGAMGHGFVLITTIFAATLPKTSQMHYHAVDACHER